MNKTTAIAGLLAIAFTGYYIGKPYYDAKRTADVIYIDGNTQVYKCNLVKSKGNLKLVRK